MSSLIQPGGVGKSVPGITIRLSRHRFCPPFMRWGKFTDFYPALRIKRRLKILPSAAVHCCLNQDALDVSCLNQDALDVKGFSGFLYRRPFHRMLFPLTAVQAFPPFP